MENSDRKIVYICLFISVVGLISIYLIALRIESIYLPINQITPEFIGRKIEIVGFVTDRYDHPDGHIFITVEDDSGHSIDVPLFSSFSKSFNSMNSQKAKLDEIRVGSLLEIEGIVGQYRNDMQIVPKKPDDLRILYD